MHNGTPGLFRVECTFAGGCAAVCCGVGDPPKAIRALGWLMFYGSPLCPLHRPDGLVAGASEAAKYQAAVTVARMAEGLAAWVVREDPGPAIHQAPRPAWMVTGDVWAPADHPTAVAAARQLADHQRQPVPETVPAIVQRGPPAVAPTGPEPVSRHPAPPSPWSRGNGG